MNISTTRRKTTSASILLEDASIAVQATERSVVNLERLVRRRGHTNDPTGDIDSCMTDFKSCMGEVVASAQSIQNEGSSSNRKKQYQTRKHYQVIAASVEGRGKELTERFQKALAVRSHVLKMQAQRKKMLVNTTCSTNTTSIGSNNSSVGSAAMAMQTQFNSPLFTMTGYETQTYASSNNRQKQKEKQQSQPPAAAVQVQNVNVGMRSRRRKKDNDNTTIQQNGSKASSSNYYAANNYRNHGYASSYNSTYSHSTMNDERDKSNSANSMQMQVQERKAARDTKARLDNARQVESAIAELGQMFGKMANLVASQQEVVDKIEDDIEAAAVQVNAGAPGGAFARRQFGDAEA